VAKIIAPDARLLLRAIRKGDVSAFFAFGDYLEEQGVEDRALRGWRILLEETRFYCEQRAYTGWDGDMVDVYGSLLYNYFVRLSDHYKLGWRMGQSKVQHLINGRIKFIREFLPPFIAAMIKFNKAKIQNQQR
jgi:hypothetical protein